MRLFLFLLSLLLCTRARAQEKLAIGPNHRFLVTESGDPFVWIGDTHWFFAKLPPATIDSLLDKRAEQGYTVMFVSCREEMYNGTGGPGPIDTPNEAWWAYLDEYIQKCADRGMYVGITLGWWNMVKKHDAAELYDYAHRIGRRYKDTDNIIWLTMGETGSNWRKDTLGDDKVAALVKGIRDGDTGNKLLTIHADYRRATSLSNDALLCDFNNWQTSQWAAPDSLPRKDDRHWTVWEAIAHDYALRYDGLPKPTLDSEAMYERNKDFCGATPYEIRRRAWFTILAGGFGHTYGGGGGWDGLTEPEGCSGSALEAVHYEGAAQIGHVATFLRDLGDDLLQLQPDQSIIINGNSNSYERHIQAARARDAGFVVVYSANDGQYTLNLSEMNMGRRPRARWFNPRVGSYEGGERLKVNKLGHITVDPPDGEGAGHDWVLLLR